jgi:hypothetical protein
MTRDDVIAELQKEYDSMSEKERTEPFYEIDGKSLSCQDIFDEIKTNSATGQRFVDSYLKLFNLFGK